MINLIAHENPKSPIAEAYRTIRTNIQFSGVDKKLKTIVITSATPNEGKSTVISNLGAVMAQAGNRVLIVDCDFRNPTQHKIFGLENKGLSNCIAMNKVAKERIQKTEIANLEVIASGPVAPNPSELLGSKRMEQVITELEEDYDYILIDSPPILPVTDAAILAGKADALIQVVAAGQVTPDEAKAAKKRLVQAGANIIGAILNKVEVSNSKYGYGYGYYYYYGHDEQGEHQHHSHQG